MLRANHFFPAGLVQVIGRGWIADLAQDETVNRPAVAGIDLIKRIDITLGVTQHQGLIREPLPDPAFTGFGFHGPCFVSQLRMLCLVHL